MLSEHFVLTRNVAIANRRCISCAHKVKPSAMLLWRVGGMMTNNLSPLTSVRCQSSCCVNLQAHPIFYVLHPTPPWSFFPSFTWSCSNNYVFLRVSTVSIVCDHHHNITTCGFSNLAAVQARYKCVPTPICRIFSESIWDSDYLTVTCQLKSLNLSL